MTLAVCQFCYQDPFLGGQVSDTCSRCGALLPGVQLEGRYQIVRALGLGGCARTYLVEDAHVKGKPLVVKEMLDSFTGFAPQEMLDRFEGEVEKLATLNHPCIPKITDRFTDRVPARHYFAMEFVDGETLEAVVTRTISGGKGHPAMPEATVVGWALRILDVLSYVHGQNLCHRDLKPANVLWRKSDDSLVLIDFGIARAATSRQGETDKLGTPGYAAPEQREGQVEQRSDLYALGAMMHCFLTGVSPEYHPAEPNVWPPKVLFPPIAARLPAVDPGLAAVVARAVEYRREDRYASAQEMKQALEALRKAAPAIPSPVRPSPGAAPVLTPYVMASTQGRVNPVDGAPLVHVLAGAFVMGNSEEAVAALIVSYGVQAVDEQAQLWTETPPRRCLFPKGFWIYQVPVTNEQYQRFLQANPHKPVPQGPLERPAQGLAAAEGWQLLQNLGESAWDPVRRAPPAGKAQHPVVGLSYWEASEYARWAGMRLPREEEWERAARGTDGRAFPWGNDVSPEKCHCALNGASGTAEVGRHPEGASPVGCLDMAGNVREWTCSPWQPYPGSRAGHCEYGRGCYVTRGSSWQDGQLWRARSSARGYYHPEVRNGILGFRCMVSE